MTILILYATTEGQTRKIARKTQTDLAALGRSTELLPFSSAGRVTLTDYAGVLLLASVHTGRYQPEFIDFATAQATELAKVPHVFFSVSLSAAGDDSKDWDGLAGVVSDMTDATGWEPKRLEHVAGAFRFSEYNWFKTWSMRWIASQKGIAVPDGEDLELTDWAALKATVVDWATSLKS